VGRITRLRMVLNGLPTLVGTRSSGYHLERTVCPVPVPPGEGGARSGVRMVQDCEKVVEILLQYCQVYLKMDIPNLSA
jgi:hypothetical protein